MKKILKNKEMELMLNQLSPILEHKTMLGYVAARNYRILSENLTEYTKTKNDLVQEYGTDITDEKGHYRFGVSPQSPNYQTVVDKLTQFAEIEHEVEIMTVKAKDVIGELSGFEILDLDWMIEHDDE